jgi:hypothetical protein
MGFDDCRDDGGSGIGGVAGVALDNISRLGGSRSTANEEDGDTGLMMPFSSRRVGVRACGAALW